jgi:4-amino-4-deoxy-L-arabinose transferase-like glycosyltransferase
MDTTPHDLRLLSIGYFIQGGIVTSFGLLALCYLAFFEVMFTAVQNGSQANPQNQMPPGVLYALGAIGTAVVLVMLASGICLLYSGSALRKRKRKTFVLIMAALNCLSVPYGTVLGVFTFLVLQRPEAKELFAPTP